MNKKIRRVALAVLLLAVFTVGGVLAYFTDGDTKTNEFTVGKISIDLIEPAWDASKALEVTPKAELSKDPHVKNDGQNDAFVFLTVEAPVENLVTAADNGTRQAAADIELFSYGYGSTAGVRDDWVLIGTYLKDASTHEYGQMIARDGTVDLTGKEAIKRVYAYASTSGSAVNPTVLAADAFTPALFDYVKVANIVEDQIDLAQRDIVVNAYGIQTQNVLEDSTIYDGSNADGSADAVAIWGVIVNANPTLNDKGADAEHSGYTAPTATVIA